jgi:hypothetical protein
MSGYSLLLLQRWGLGWRACDISYGTQAAVTEGNSTVHNIPLSQIQVEGANNHKNGIPEHITGPLRARTPSFEYMRRSLKILCTWLRTSVTCFRPYAVYNGVQYFKLSSILENYNRDLDFLARQDPKWKLYRMHAKDPVYATWVVGQNKTHDFGEMNTQSNLEIPFRAIGQQSGGTDLAAQFGPRNKSIFLGCRQKAQELCQARFAARRRQLRGKATTDQVKLERLNSLFTLYYFSVIMHYLNEKPSQLKSAMHLLKQNGKVSNEDTEENRATKNKNQWGLLPKVEWSDLFKNALSAIDRQILSEVFQSGVAWATLKAEMTRHIKQIEPGIDAMGDAWILNMHEAIMRTHSRHLSSTGKPLPIELAPANKVIRTTVTDDAGRVLSEEQELKGVMEPMIVFEFRHGGHDTRRYNIQFLGKPEEDLTTQLLNALDGLQGYA